MSHNTDIKLQEHDTTIQCLEEKTTTGINNFFSFFAEGRIGPWKWLIWKKNGKVISVQPEGLWEKKKLNCLDHLFPLRKGFKKLCVLFPFLLTKIMALLVIILLKNKWTYLLFFLFIPLSFFPCEILCMS